MNSSLAQDVIDLVLVDDHLLFRQSLKSMLSALPDINVVGESGDGRKGLQMIQSLRPHVAVLDITMPSMGGIELARLVRDIAPECHIMMLSMHDTVSYAFEAFKAGCRGYVLKSDSRDDLLQAIRKVARGENFLSPQMSGDFVNSVIGGFGGGKGKDALLSHRETEICRLVIQARSNKQIADSLCISEKTVRVHIANAMKKLSCRSRTELALRFQKMESETV